MTDITIHCAIFRTAGNKVAPVHGDRSIAQDHGLRWPWENFDVAKFAIERAGCIFCIETREKVEPEAAKKPAKAKKAEPKSRKAMSEAQKKQAAKEFADVHTTREAWLLAAIELFRPWFVEKGAAVPEKVYASCGWALGTRKAIGQAFYASHCADGSHAVFVSPIIADASRALDILLHELVHTALEPGVMHKAPFARLAGSLGLVKPWTATTASPELVERLKPILAKLGNYPHARLDGSKRKKQGTRLLKADCATCGYTVRITAKWLDQSGLPHCPQHGEMKCDSWEGEAEDNV